MPRKNIHDPIFEAEISAWECAEEPFHAEKISEFYSKIPREDILGRSELAGRILERLKSDDCPPALGIYGGWGTGKTSLLNLMKLINAEKWGNQFLHIERIDAWKYEGTGNLFTPVIALLKKLAGSGIRDIGAWYECAKRILTVTALASANGISNKIVGFGLDEIQARYAEADDKSFRFKWENLTDSIQETEVAFKNIVQVALNNIKSSRLVLCIDNLDRCSPENVVSLLESIKNFVGVENCIWVFAMDSGVVASYINHKYEGTTMDGNSYLDKIIPEQFHLSLTPSKDEDPIVRLILRATGGDALSLETARLPLLPRVLVPRRLIKSARKLNEFFELNPVEISRSTIFALTLLYHSWPEFYERLSSPEEMHIGGILANFFRKNEHASWGSYKVLPMDKGFTNDQELTYFLQKSFPDYGSDEHIPALTREILFAIEGLRLIGLP